jgi:hypothetical protein
MNKGSAKEHCRNVDHDSRKYPQSDGDLVEKWLPGGTEWGYVKHFRTRGRPSGRIDCEGGKTA